MSWEVKAEPKYNVGIRVEGIELEIEYDVANMGGEDEWDYVASDKDIKIRGIFHQDIDIKRIVRGFPRGYIQNMVYERHHETWLKVKKS